MFQFQTGAIKRQAAVHTELKKNGFNSKLVRLKERAGFCGGNDKKGFNSKLVRLKESSSDDASVDEF